MLDNSFFVSTKVQEREVSLADGKKHKLYFKEITAADVARYLNALNSSDEDSRSTANQKLISLSLCDADGKLAITFEQACQLKANVIVPLLNAVSDVNGLGEQKND